jgi:capsular polysaccharide biosynthesis protein
MPQNLEGRVTAPMQPTSARGVLVGLTVTLIGSAGIVLLALVL